MTMRTLKLILITSTILIVFSMFLAFLVAPYLGALYQKMALIPGNDLPRLTKDFSLPLLRIEPLIPYQRPVNSFWVSICWGAIIVAPILIMTWAIGAATTEACLSRWMGGIMIYFPIILSLFIADISGLLIAVAPFPVLVLP